MGAGAAHVVTCKGKCDPGGRMAIRLKIAIRRMPPGRGGGSPYGPGDFRCGVCWIMISGWNQMRCPCCHVRMRRHYYPDGTPTGRGLASRAMYRRRASK